MTADTPHDSPDTPLSVDLPPDRSTRPRWSAAEAARRTGASRATIQAALASGRLTGAEKTDRGWLIPLEALIAAGFPPKQPKGDGRHVTDTPGGDGLDRRVRELETALTAAEARADMSAVQRDAEREMRLQAALQVQDLRGNIEDLRSRVRELEAAPPPTPLATLPASTEPSIPVPPSVGNLVANPPSPVAKTSWWHRRREQ